MGNFQVSGQTTHDDYISTTFQVIIKGDVHEKFSYQYKYSPNSKIYTNGPNGLKFGMLGAFGC